MKALQDAGKYGTPWTHDELVLAFYLYCQIPFAQTTARNSDVARLAHYLGRTPSSVARKLGNFGTFDPLLAAQGITGLVHHSKADREIWDKFSGHWTALVRESQRILASLSAGDYAVPESAEAIMAIPVGPTVRLATVPTRVYQSFFRRAVLSSYDFACCICGIDMQELLIASHIIAWSRNESTRTDPQNGLCLCSLHDRAFDRGLLRVNSETYQVQISRRVILSKSDFVGVALTAFEGKPIALPRRFAPKSEYLDWHTQNVFLR
jgi:putative restriction endonuclease